jgi:hypothetical protein
MNPHLFYLLPPWKIETVQSSEISVKQLTSITVQNQMSRISTKPIHPERINSIKRGNFPKNKESGKCKHKAVPMLN